MGNECCGGGQPTLAKETLDFIAAKTQASKEDVEEQYTNFLANYPDGKITKKCFGVMMQKCFPDQNVSKVESHIFRMYDFNSDGKIDFREFMILLTIMGSGSVEENLQQIFRIFDVDNSGTISQKEMNRIVKDMYSLLSKEDNPMGESEENLSTAAFAEMDKDGDSKVTKEEFMKACLSHEKISSMLTLKLVDILVAEEL